MSDLLGKRIGHFRVIDLIGKGGMGEVYVAHDETLERKVALKTIRAEQKLNEAARVRFLREARVLSQLAHPNICQIFDYVEGDEVDLLVLELIRGRNLARAMKEGLRHEQKLKIAKQIATVLVAAHTRDIVHRDLKPDNVMLTDEGEVKVLDFGLSRTLVEEDTMVLEENAAREARPGGHSDLETIPGDGPSADVQGNNGRSGRPKGSSARASSGKVTAYGSIMGTPGYMSPEQAAGLSATTASDIYSFGLFLQELFTGKRPFVTGPLHEMIERARDGITLPVEGIDPDIASLINRLKAVAPALRPSAVDTLERIQWIIEKPIRKRKRVLVAASIVILTLFSVVMTIQTVRATRAERAAEREAEVANRITQFMVDLFDVSDPFEKKSGEAVTARELLDKGAARIEEELKDQPAVQARLMTTMGTVYRKLGLFDRAEPQLERAALVAEKTGGSNPTDFAETLFALGSLYSDQGKYEKAQPLFERSLKLREELLGIEHPAVADVLNNMAALQGRQGKFKEAETLLRRSVAIREKAFGQDAPIIANALNNLAVIASLLGRSGEAEGLYKRSLAIREKAFGPSHPRVADSLNNLAVHYFESGRLSDAEPFAERALSVFERALGPEHPHVAHSLNNLGELRHLQGKLSEAEPLYQRSLAIYEKINGPEHPDVAYELNYLGKLYVDQNRISDAEPRLKRALSIYEKSVGADHPDTAHALFNLAALEARRGSTVASLEYLRRAFPKGSGTPWASAIEKDPAFSSLQSHPEFKRIAALAKKTE